MKLRKLYFLSDSFLKEPKNIALIVRRLEIMNEAVKLHKEKRYTSCITLIVSQLDWVCSDTTGRLTASIRPRIFFVVLDTFMLFAYKKI
ncbi:hypothetical protein DRQ25_13920 [Candidatus Fermentibacteria bacterium]|nr:MAG: hypothetical protein DRQ25_13920 [Candidatus Fermentibacteria bacterium]